MVIWKTWTLFIHCTILRILACCFMAARWLVPGITFMNQEGGSGDIKKGLGPVASISLINKAKVSLELFSPWTSVNVLLVRAVLCGSHKLCGWLGKYVHLTTSMERQRRMWEVGNRCCVIQFVMSAKVFPLAPQYPHILENTPYHQGKHPPHSAATPPWSSQFLNDGLSSAKCRWFSLESGGLC